MHGNCIEWCCTLYKGNTHVGDNQQCDEQSSCPPCSGHQCVKDLLSSQQCAVEVFLSSRQYVEHPFSCEQDTERIPSSQWCSKYLSSSKQDLEGFPSSLQCVEHPSSGEQDF